LTVAAYREFSTLRKVPFELGTPGENKYVPDFDRYLNMNSHPLFYRASPVKL
jgi:hypothetical protein